VCYLCGNLIDAEKPTRDHVPPQQFFPKELRVERNLNLWVAPTHNKCNEDYREDEEYFYATMFSAVARGNPKMHRIMYNDFLRRTNNPQTPAMMRRTMKGISSISSGGIHLPRGLLQVKADCWRLDRVVKKITRGLYWIDHNRFMPNENCFDLRYCDEPEKVPEVYRFKHPDQPKGACTDVFSYTHFDFDGRYFWVLVFWKAFSFCIGYDEPKDSE